MSAGCAACSDPCVPAATEVEAPTYCSVPRDFAVTNEWEIVLDPNVPASRAEAVRGALVDWQNAVPCGLGFYFVTGPTTWFADEKLPAPGTIEVRMEADLPDGATGWANSFTNGGSRIAFKIGADDADLPRVARHELGHAFHLPHDDGPAPSLMNGFVGRYRDIQSRDVEAYAAIWCRGAIIPPI